ncbi:MAG: PIN domain nuclease [Nevskiales bacterium]|nr:PIN domain nuclease [Nevskiales bacterium]
MYLADTSVWIDALRTAPGHQGQRLLQLMTEEAPVYVCGPIVQEVLQGARDEPRWHWYRERLGVQRFIQMEDAFATHAAAALLHARCRWRGLTVRSSTDCLIAQVAIEHHLVLLHDDADYEKIARIEPRLKLA